MNILQIICTLQEVELVMKIILRVTQKRISDPKDSYLKLFEKLASL